jgi:membrane fusion protein (multidrug efflux system)
VLAGVLASGCMPASESVESVEFTAIQVGGEDVVLVTSGEILVGPFVSGELRAQRSATVRAELSGPVVEAPLEEGQSVRVGSLVARIDAPALEDARRSAASGLRSAIAGVGSVEAQLALAEREFARTAELVKVGAIAMRELDVAQQTVTAADAQVTAAEALVADAEARLVVAEQQLADAVLRAPIDGVVAEKAVSVGDVVSPGAAVVTIIDPSTMQLEASVPSESLTEVEVDMIVRFQVRGYRESFEGRIARISPQVNPATRQVAIFVTIATDARRLVAGLFVEGRVVNEMASGLIVPENAVNVTGGSPWVLRVREEGVERVEVTLGLRDPRSEQVQIVSGVQAGDRLLRGAAQGILPGTAVRVEAQ